MKKKAELFTADRLIDILEEQGKEFGYKVDNDTDYDIENTTTISYLGDDDKLYLSVVVLHGGIYTKINIFDQNGQNIFSKSVKAANFDIKEYRDVIDKVFQELGKNVKFLLNTPEKIYDYGEENNWQGLEQKHYEILSQDASLAQMAVADMQDKELEIPETLKKFRRYSMSLKDVVISKIAKEKIATKKVASATKTLKKKAEEDLDVKLKVQKNKPAGLDTSTPKSLPESIRPLMQDLKGKMATLKETEAELADVKAGLDAKYQEAKNKSQIVEKQAEIENLTQNIGKLLFAAKNETFQFQDNLVALTHQTKVVPAKATDKWKFEKVFAKLQELMGDENAQKFLDATLNGLQSQATEKTITELNIFSPTQKQMKTSDTSDTNSFIDALKEIYTNLRSYFIDVKKANNILEEQLATGTTASKKSNVSKKANVDKKAENMVTMELPLANYMEMLKDRAKEIGRSLYLADELEDYFLAVGGNVLEPMTFVDNYLINGEFVEKEEFTADGNYSELYEEYNGSWEEMCENAAIFYNDEMACLNLGV